jgi:methionine-gamma-lyase
MGAIATSLVSFLKLADVLLHSNPIYGGTYKFICQMLHHWGVISIGFKAGDTKKDIIKKIEEKNAGQKLRMIYAETPANPTNDLIDISMCAEIAAKYSNDEKKVLVAVDNTYMGSLWQHPLKHGTDIVLYSATKYFGGHSDLIAGAAIGNKKIIQIIKRSRTVFGTMIDPHNSWLLMRSLETLKIRMEAAAANAE